MTKSVYIHIPFCKNICSYCDFCKFIYNEKWVGAYLTGLNNEIKDRYMDDPIKTIYIGGGTPSALSIDELKRLFKIISVFNTNDLEEFTFECNLSDINEGLLEILKNNKVNRLSIGIQSFNKKNLAFMERNADFKDALKKVDLCHQYGFNNINLDLMYAVPGETLKDLKKDLNLFLKLNPTHISTYSLILEDHTKLSSKNVSYIEEELDYEMFKLISKKLNSANHYEISNFSKPGYQSRHNLVYWNNENYYGFGLSAASYIENIRRTNTSSLKKYLAGNFLGEEEVLTKKDILSYALILGFRKIEGINKNMFFKKYGVNLLDLYNIKDLLKKGLLKENAFNIYIPCDKIYIENSILINFVGE